MALWDRIRNFFRQETHQLELPHKFELIPGALSVTFDVAEVSDQAIDDGGEPLAVPCWLFFTEGLQRLGQEEIVLLVTRGGEHDMSEVLSGPFKFFRVVHELATKNQLVTVGGRSRFRDPTLLGWDNVSGIIYIRPVPLCGVNLPKMPSIVALMLIGEELTVAEEFGQQRVLARLGHHYRYYPYPLWSDPHRLPVTSIEDMKGSLLGMLPRTGLRAAHVTKRINRVVLTLLPTDKESLHEVLTQIPTGGGVAILTGMDPQADSNLVYIPGAAEHSAISPRGSDGSRLGGCYLTVLRTEDGDTAGIHEDGFFVKMREASWQGLLDALELGKPFWLEPTDGSLWFELEWILQDYWDPIEGKLCHSEQGWKVFHPAGRSGTGGNEKCRIFLLSSVIQLEDRVEMDALSSYVLALEDAVKTRLSTEVLLENYSLVVDVQLSPLSPPSVRMANRSGSVDETLQRIEPDLRETLTNVAAPVATGPVRFQLHFELTGVAGGTSRVQ